ncbi:rhomboid family intramembrane serine protease [Ovoidimarina sediminis]|uniref:rhomboid family intramembrane serine protease n=1 Tax=Ovoidimarina sediminis TaxID=3079856 RepID=UPI002910087B|nr:rhomboid family intramembrane serine protease [Rhodophyticola sp. MJ-SS7]MDU8943701.1 rhomboid family intramembrane serine protease [Rhodophyticola sp. MJ-SS7]
MSYQPSDPDASPVNPLPVAVVLLALPMILAEIAFIAGTTGLAGGPEAVGWRLAAIERFGFFSPVVEWMASTGRWNAPDLARFVTYPFLHWGFTHMLMVLVFLLALGKMVGEVMGSLAVFIVFFGSAVFGAGIYALLTEAQNPLIGGYPGVYGLIGAYSFILWTHYSVTGGPQARAFTLIAALLFIQLVFGLLFGKGPDWIADVAGFVAGFVLSFVVVPGGWARLINRLRQR